MFIKKLSEKIPFYAERLLVPPGVTGWAQVMHPYAASIEESRRKLQYDLYYIKHMSFLLDAYIMLKTIKTILFGRERAKELPVAAPAQPSEVKTDMLFFPSAPPAATTATTVPPPQAASDAHYRVVEHDPAVSFRAPSEESLDKPPEARLRFLTRRSE